MSGWSRRFRLPESARLANLGSMPPNAVAAIVALGVVFGVFPAPVCPTLFCALAAVALRLNPPAIQMVNYLVYPLQIALMAPFAGLGGRMFPATAGPIGGHDAVWRAASAVGTAGAHAVAGWFCVCGPLGALLYLALAWVLRRHGSWDWPRSAASVR